MINHNLNRAWLLPAGKDWRGRSMRGTPSSTCNSDHGICLCSLLPCQLLPLRSNPVALPWPLTATLQAPSPSAGVKCSGLSEVNSANVMNDKVLQKSMKRIITQGLRERKLSFFFSFKNKHLLQWGPDREPQDFSLAPSGRQAISNYLFPLRHNTYTPHVQRKGFGKEQDQNQHPLTHRRVWPINNTFPAAFTFQMGYFLSWMAGHQMGRRSQCHRV